MRKFIFQYLLIMCAAALFAPTTITTPTQAKPDDAIINLSQLQRQLWNSRWYLITSSILVAGSYLALSQGNKKNRISSVRWAKSQEKVVTHKIDDGEIQLCVCDEKHSNIFIEKSKDRFRKAGLNNITKRIDESTRFTLRSSDEDTDESESIFKKIARQLEELERPTDEDDI